MPSLHIRNHHHHHATLQSRSSSFQIRDGLPLHEWMGWAQTWTLARSSITTSSRTMSAVLLPRLYLLRGKLWPPVDGDRTYCIFLICDHVVYAFAIIQTPLLASGLTAITISTPANRPQCQTTKSRSSRDCVRDLQMSRTTDLSTCVMHRIVRVMATVGPS
jgi:hypothetical protein